MLILRNAAALFVLAGCSAIGAAAKGDPPPIVNTTFETDPGDWKVFGVNGQALEASKLSITHAPADVKEGKGTLKLAYSIKQGDTTMLALPFQPPSLAKMKSIHFWVKLDHASSLLMVVSEKDGGRYQEMIACPANTWQEVNVGMNDLTLSTDDNAPQDPDGKLDPDQVDSIAFIDADCFLAQILGATPFINIASGDHTLLLNSFTVNETALPGPPATPNAVPLTPLLRPQADWLVLGDFTLKRVEEKPLSGASIRVDYTQTRGKINGMIKMVTPGTFTGMKTLSMSVATLKPAKYKVQIEETNGDKFSADAEFAGNSEAKALIISTDDFVAADDSKNPNAKLDLTKVKQLVLIDISGLGDIQDTNQTIWINGLKIVK